MDDCLKASTFVVFQLMELSSMCSDNVINIPQGMSLWEQLQEKSQLRLD